MIVEYNSKWRFTEQDLHVGLGTHDYERKFLGITEPLTPKGIFPAFVYSILSAAQNTSQLVRVFDRIKRSNLMDPDAMIAADEAKIKGLLSTTHFPNQKFNRFVKFREWWLKEENACLIFEICANSNQGGLAHTRNLRNRLVNAECAGVGYKVASFILQLSIKDPKRVNVVVIDKWVLTFLGDIGFAVKAPDYKTVCGLFWGFVVSMA